ncbi:MAG: acetoacetate--CoA ligase [Alphaproteobacteria bacterium]
MEKPLFAPSRERIEAANLTRFRRQIETRLGLRFATYADFHRFSVEDPDRFWAALWDFLGIVAETRGKRVMADPGRMPGTLFFPDARLNLAENFLRRRDGAPAIIFRGEDRVRRTVSYAELYDQVSRMAQALAAAGLNQGDRVAGFMPNLPEAIVAFLAAASLGAVWTSCSPDFGVSGVLDRFGQTAPTILFAADGYFYNGKSFDTREKLAAITRDLPSVRKVVIFPYLDPAPAIDAIPSAVLADEFVRPFQPQPIAFRQLSFNHPIYILYSSGTTGKPKCIVHGAGGVLIQHMKEHQLMLDVKPGDRVFYFTTLTWMMWNWLISALASQATVMLYDGAPTYPDANALWDFVAEDKITMLGLSAKYIDSLRKIGLRPGATHDLGAVKSIMSTGSPLVPESFDYMYASVKPDVPVASASGGTDICACFMGGDPTGPVWRGEIQVPAPGMRIEVFSDQGRPLAGEAGELVCTAPFPSMPLFFWNDPDGRKYHEAYFARFANVWCHGDWVERTRHGGFIIHGRSDATLNPGGVRIGTAEIYRQVEQIPEVVESIVVGQNWDNDVRVVLFVRLQAGVTLDADLRARITRQIRDGASPRHVPARILQVTDIPRTRSGKITELAVRDLIHGRPVKNVEALENPQALDQFRDREEIKT